MPPSHAEPAAPHWVVVATGVTALILVLLPMMWRGLVHVATVFHEGGHALSAVLNGRQLKGIEVPLRGDAATAYTAPRHLSITLAGYLGPTIFGLLGAVILHAGQPTSLLWLLDAGLVLVFIAMRNPFGFLVVGLLLAASLLVSWLGSAGARMGYAYVLVWFLLLAGVRDMFGLTRLWATRNAGGSDVHTARNLTGIPMAFWILFFWAGTVGGLWLGYRILMGPG